MTFSQLIFKCPGLLFQFWSKDELDGNFDSFKLWFILHFQYFPFFSSQSEPKPHKTSCTNREQEVLSLKGSLAIKRCFLTLKIRLSLRGLPDGIARCPTNFPNKFSGQFFSSETNPRCLSLHWRDCSSVFHYLGPDYCKPHKCQGLQHR